MAESSRRARPGTASSRPAAGRGAVLRGDEGRRQAAAELEYQKQKQEERKNSAGNQQPFRFYTPSGESRQIIICDDAPDFFFYEHALKDEQGRYNRVFSGCTKVFSNCPVCESTGRESYYALALTCIDLTEFESKNGDVNEFSRKLLIVKPAQQKKFLRFYEKEGSLRGALFEMTRDGDTDASIGNDIEFVEWVPEEEMLTYVRTWQDRDRKTHTENCDEPYDYEAIFPDPDDETLMQLVGGRPQAGSRAANSRTLNSNSSRDRGTSRPSAPAARPARGRQAAAEDGADYEDADDTRTQSRSASRGGRAAEAPARATRGRTAPPEDTGYDDPPFDPDDPDAADDAPAPRSTRRGAPPPTRAAPSVARGERTPARRPRTADADAQDFDGGDDAAPAPSRRAAVPPRRGRA
jgi:hypothetical protein